MSPFYWILAVILAGVWYLWYKGKLKNFKGFRLPSLSLPSFLQPDTKTVVERLEKQTEQEKAKKAELEKVLKAKKELAAVKAENRQLRKDIDRAGAGVEKHEEKEAGEVKSKNENVKAITPKRLRA